MSTSFDKAWLFVAFTDDMPTSSQLKDTNSIYGTMYDMDHEYIGKGKVLYFSQNYLTIATSIKELKDGGILTPIYENTSILTTYENDKPYKLSEVNQYGSTSSYKIYTFNDKTDAFNQTYDMYAINNNDDVIRYQRTYFNIYDENYYYGVYKYNLITPDKTTYTISLYKVKTSLFISETSDLCIMDPVYLFNSSDENKTRDYTESDSTYNYKTIECKSTPNKNYIFFMLDESHNVTSSILNHETIQNLKNNYNLTYKTGTKLTNDDNIMVNNISDLDIVNRWDLQNKMWFGFNRATSVCLYNFKQENVITRSKYYPKDVLKESEPYAVYSIDV